jgi:hypothetical protein
LFIFVILSEDEGPSSYSSLQISVILSAVEGSAFL